MSIFDNVLQVFRRSADVVKENESYTGYSLWEDKKRLVDGANYFDQYLGWTYRAVEVVSDAVASYPPRLLKVVGGGEEVEVVDGLAKDLQRFNGHQTFNEARKITSMHLRLLGMGAWQIVDASERGYKYEFVILNPQRLELVTDKQGMPSKYVYDGKQVIALENLIIFRSPHPKNYWQGFSPLMASRLQHNTHEFMSEYNMNFFGNMGIPQGFLSINGIGEDQKKQVERMLKARYGGVKNAGKVGVTNMDVKWTQLSATQKDLDWTEGLKTMRDEILALHGVPKPLVGLTDSTYTNSIEAQRVFQRYTVLPLLRLEADVFNEQLIKEYYGARAEGFRFEVNDPVEADVKSDAEVARIAFEGGIVTRNEARGIMGMIEIESEDGERFYTDLVQRQPYYLPEVDEAKEEEKAVIADEVVEEKGVAETREEMKKYFYEKSVEQEEKMERVIRSLFASQRERVLQSITGAKGKKKYAVGFSVADEVDLFFEGLITVWLDIAREYEGIANELIVTPQKLSRKERAALQDMLRGSVKIVNENTEGRLKEIIATANDENWGILDMKDKIDEIYEGYTGTRARSEVIARTEVNRVKSFVTDTIYSKDSFVEGREWLSASDRFVRDSHRVADGQIKAKGEKFEVGGELLMYPSDPKGSPENTINCRCTVIPVVKSV